MKTYETQPDGSRLVRITRNEWEGLAAATDLAYQDPDAVPAEFRPVGETLYRDFHEEGSGATRRAEPAPPPSPDRPWRWSPFTNLCQGCGLRFRLSWDCLSDCVEQGLIGALPDGDDATIEAAARAVPLGDVASAAEYCLHCVAGDEAPAEEYVTEGESFAGGGRGVAAFVADYGTPFFPHGGARVFLGVVARDSASGPALFAIPMLPDGSGAKTESYEVRNLVPLGLDLAAVNRVFGSAFTAEQFGAAAS